LKLNRKDMIFLVDNFEENFSFLPQLQSAHVYFS